MIHTALSSRVDLEKLTQSDFRIRGEFRVREEKHGIRVFIPEFKKEGSGGYVPFATVFPPEKFHACYELIVQTPNHAEVVGSGYLCCYEGNVSFGTRAGISISGQEQSYHNSMPVWFCLLDDTDKSIVTGIADFIFVHVSPWYSERVAQRQRVLENPPITSEDNTN